MRIEYSKGVDALYIHLRDAPVAESRDIQEGVTLDFDADGWLIGLPDVERALLEQKGKADGEQHLPQHVIFDWDNGNAAQ